MTGDQGDSQVNTPKLFATYSAYNISSERERERDDIPSEREMTYCKRGRDDIP
jgi:hypothetical protein